MNKVSFASADDRDSLNEAHAEGFRAACHFIPIGQSVTAVCYAILLYISGRTVGVQIKNIWIFFVLVLIDIIWITAALSDRQKATIKRATIAKHMILAGLAACAVLVLTRYLYHNAQGNEPIIWGGFIAALLTYDAFGMAKAPEIALSWTWMIGAGCAYRMTFPNSTLAWPEGIFVPLLGLLETYLIWSFSKSYYEKFIMNSKLKKQSQYISQILSDIEKNAGEWLWKIDDNGIITDVSDKLIQTTEKNRDDIIGVHCIKVFFDLIFQFVRVKRAAPKPKCGNAEIMRRILKLK